MSTPSAWAVVLIVLILAALVAFTIWRLTGQSSGRNYQPYVGGYMLCLYCYCPEHAAQRCSDVNPSTPIDDVHKNCADQNHHHDGMYASTVHDHPEYVTREELESWRAQYVRRDELNQLKQWMIEQLKAIRSISVVAILRILKGILFGGVAGGIFGVTLAFVLLFVLPSVYEQRLYGAGDERELLATVNNWWPMVGIVFGCAFAGAIAGGIINVIRNYLQNRQTTKENR